MVTTTAETKLQTRDLTGVELLAVGRWQGHNCPKAGCEFTRKMLDQIVKAYDATKDSLQAPVKLGHNDEQALLDGLPAAGWVTNLRRDGDRLVGDLEKVPAAVADLMAAGAYRTRSAELMPNLDVAGETYPLVFTGLALLGADLPAVQGLADITELYSSQHLSLKDGARAIVFSLPIGVSYNDLQERLRAALRARFPSSGNDDFAPWVVDLYDSTVIFCDPQSRYWQASYTVDGDSITLGEPVLTERVTTWQPAPQMMAAAPNTEDEDHDLAAELETFLARLDSRMKGKKGMPVMRAFLRETTGKLRALQSKRHISQEDTNVDEKAVRTELGLAEDGDVLEAIKALKALKVAPTEGATDVAALKTELSQTTAKLLTIEGERADERAEAKLTDAIRLGQLRPAQHDVAKKLYLLSASDFEAFIVSQPKRIEFGERGRETDEGVITLTASEQSAAKQMGISNEEVIASKQRERERVGV